jgi:polyribonucleotide nucleotidyltransferase
MVAAVAAIKAKAGQEFFPLTVDYREKAAAAGKFPAATSSAKVGRRKKRFLPAD